MEQLNNQMLLAQFLVKQKVSSGMNLIYGTSKNQPEWDESKSILIPIKEKAQEP